MMLERTRAARFIKVAHSLLAMLLAQELWQGDVVATALGLGDAKGGACEQVAVHPARNKSVYTQEKRSCSVTTATMQCHNLLAPPGQVPMPLHTTAH
jgi:hypothetical protein